MKAIVTLALLLIASTTLVLCIAASEDDHLRGNRKQSTERVHVEVQKDANEFAVRIQGLRVGDRISMLVNAILRQDSFVHTETSEKIVTFERERYPQEVAVYLTDTAGNTIVLFKESISAGKRFPSPHPTATVRSKRETNNGTNVGILYELWHAPIATVMHNISAMGGLQLTVEDVIRSNGKSVLSDITLKYNLFPNADGFFYQAKPALGFYCVFPNASHAEKAAEREGFEFLSYHCPNTSNVLRTHANLLVSAGVDYVVTDSTNLGTPTPEAMVLQQLPLEVLFEEWAALRESGTPTPSIAVWQVIYTGCTLWQNMLDLYNNPRYEDLVYRDPKTGKKVFFIPENPQLLPDEKTIASILSNGGRNDTVIVKMWALFPSKEFSEGKWAFFSPCTDDSGDYTTSVVGLHREDTPCNQHQTSNSPLGTAISVSPSYQLSYSSLPMCAAGKFRGAVFKRQFRTALETQTSPDQMFLSSWNEFTSQPQQPAEGKYEFSMGLPSDPNSNMLFVDTYGSSISRDIEPTVEDGDLFYDIMKSCIRVLKLNAALNQTGCSVTGEECCSSNATNESYNVVWSLRRTILGETVDNLLTSSKAEFLHLTKDVKTYTEICNAYSGPTDFCVDTALANNVDALRGPFIVYANNATDVSRPTLFRCYDNSRHFFSTDENCLGIGHVESVLGFASTVRSSETPRSLILCAHKGSVSMYYYHMLDDSCDGDDQQLQFVGYVH